MAQEFFAATGRRKEASASVRIYPEGSGKITINDREFEDYMPRPANRFSILRPLEITEMVGKFDVRCSVKGGGLRGQADAISLGISRALVQYNVELRGALKAQGLMTRDPREKERKKYGLAGARKRFQFSKR